MNLPVRVTSTDYAYDGVLIAVVIKTSGALRYVVEDANGRLFIHNAQQLGQEEGWSPIEESIRWRALGATRQSGIRCKEPVFWAYLREERNYKADNEIDAAAAVRSICGVVSRSDFAKPGHGTARSRWAALDRDYQTWKAHENAH